MSVALLAQGETVPRRGMTTTSAPSPASAAYPVSVLAADINGDGQVNASDLSIFTELFKKKDLKADMNNDGKIDASDLSIFLRAKK